MLIFQWLAGDIFKKLGHYILSAVIPAKAGIQNGLNLLDSRLRGNDNYMNYANQARKSGKKTLPVIAKMVSKGILHHRTAARYTSRLQKHFNKI